MKRLKLADFKVKNLKKDKAQEVDQLLGQVLGDCHDTGTSKGSGIYKYSNITIKR